jgi:glycosyltransferase involved in cell wall biosynthesis
LPGNNLNLFSALARVAGAAGDVVASSTVKSGAHIAVVIPALNEERAIGAVVAAIPGWVDEVVVVDNGSTDATARIAGERGARVVREARRGYGAACRRGADAVSAGGAAGAERVIVFLDGDGSFDPREMEALVRPILERGADLVIGKRARGRREPGALTLQQRLGNALSCALIRSLYGARCTDLGPFRAVRAEALERLALDDLGLGWTIQMQVRAALRGLSVAEAEVSCRRRAAGESKVSGTVRGAVGAGAKFMYVIFGEALRARLPRR